MKDSTKKRRFLELDLIRGVCNLLMVLDHFVFFNLNYALQIKGSAVYDIAFYALLRSILTNEARKITRYVILVVFFTVSGICTQLSKNNLKRGLKLSVLALAISIVTITISAVANIDFKVYFGVIHFYAACVLAYYLIEKINSSKLKIGAYVILILISIMFVIFRPTLPDSNLLMFLGVPKHNYVARFDYFPIFPGIAVFITGVFIGKRFYRKERKEYNLLSKPIFFPIIKLGQKGMIVYAVHIPVLMLVSFVVFSTLI